MISRIWNELAYRLRSVFHRGEVERELAAELQFHIDHEVDRLVREGAPHSDAVRRARASFGGVERIKDDTRDAHGISLLEQASQDLRYAIRGLGARPAFTFGVVATLSLGIGANATMFGIVDRLLFRPPPSLRDASTVHRLYRHTLDEGEPRVDRNFAFATYLDLKRTLTTFSSVAAFQTTRMPVGDGEAVREVPVTVATANYFDFFDTRPTIGRFFTAAEDSIPEGADVVVLGYGFWQATFAGQDVRGQTLRVGSTLRTIIGVAPEEFVGMSGQGVPALYVPIASYAFGQNGKGYPNVYTWSWLEMIARRKPDVTVTAATVDLTSAFTQSWRNAYARNAEWGSPEAARVSAEIAPVQMNRGPQAGRDAQVVKWIGGVAIIVLLIACANVANLLLSRAISRRREIAVRLALGVSRARLTRQLMTESLVLAVLGGAGGLAIAQWSAAGLRRWFLPADLAISVFTDVRTLVFAGVTTFLVAVVTGIVPAIRAGRADVGSALRAVERGMGQQHARIRTGLLVFQVSLSFVLLVGAGLFVRSLRNASEYRLGYDADHLLFVTMRARGVRLSPAEQWAYDERLQAAARSIPGVTHTTHVQSVPFWGNDAGPLEAPGVDSVNSRGLFILQLGTPDYFATAGTRILRGRAFDATDRAGTAHVVVVSEGMARAIWRGKDALGQCLRFPPRDGVAQPCMTVVGIAEEMHLRSFADQREYSYYVPAIQYGRPLEGQQFFVRVAGSPRDMVEPLRQRLQAEMPGTAYISAFPMATLVEPSLRSWRMGATMFVVFGGLALALAAIGVYSLVAYDVAQRRRDISVRIALGASVSRIVGFVVGRGARVVTAGIAIGSGVALWAAPWLESQMFQQPARDPAVFAVVIAWLVAAGLAATAVPALRASRVDPNAALRED